MIVSITAALDLLQSPFDAALKGDVLCMSPVSDNLYILLMKILVLQDVTTFLAWAAEPEHDERKLMGAKWIFILSVVLLTAGYYKRWKWAPLKSRKVIVDAIN